MPTIVSHPAIPLALVIGLSPELNTNLLVAGVICSVLPDIDVVGFGFGIHYGGLFGHRGFTHSLFFAVVIAGLFTWMLLGKGGPNPWITFLFLFVCSASHGLLDAMTNGGLGISFFSPFSNQRYFLKWRPIDVSPIGIYGFFSDGGLHVLRSELQWVWLPSTILGIVLYVFRRV